MGWRLLEERRLIRPQAVQSFRLADGEALPAVNSIILLGPWTLRVEGAWGQTITVVVIPDGDVSLIGAEAWRYRRGKLSRDHRLTRRILPVVDFEVEVTATVERDVRLFADTILSGNTNLTAEGLA